MEILKNRWSRVVEKFEKFFDDPLPTDPDFQPRHSVEELRSLLSIEESVDRDRAFFSQLSNFFEMGFLLRAHPQAPPFKMSMSIPQMTFTGGQVFLIPEDESWAIELPLIRTNECRRVPASFFLDRLGIPIRDPYQLFTALLFQPAPPTQIVVITRQADPWLAEKCEHLLPILQNFFWQNP